MGGAIQIAGTKGRLAIATVWDGDRNYECGLPLWCRSASRLAALLPKADVILIAKLPSAECRQAKLFWDPTTEEAAVRYLSQQRSIRGSWGVLRKSVFLKLMAFALVDYTTVFFTDLDVDVLPEHMEKASVRAAIQAGFARYQSLAASEASLRFVASPDHSAPVNGGILLLKPNATLHIELLHNLCAARWSTASGFTWDASDSPDGHGQAAAAVVHGPRDAYPTHLLPQLARGLGASESRAGRMLNGTHMMKNNTWFFNSGNLGQGFLWTAMYLQRGIGSWAALLPQWGGRGGAADPAEYQVEHFWGLGKPWLESFASHTYLKRVVLHIDSHTPADTRCVREMVRLSIMLKKRGHWEEGAGRRPSIGRQAVLPAVDTN